MKAVFSPRDVPFSDNGALVYNIKFCLPSLSTCVFDVITIP